MPNHHVPVLLSAVLSRIKIELSEKSPTIFDATLGGGGYSLAFLDQGYKVYGSDLDAPVVNTLNEKFSAGKFEAYQGNFSEVIDRFQNGFFDVIVADLGYSSNQLEDSGRGFSYLKPAEDFDLRYDSRRGDPAYAVLSQLEEKELGQVIYRNSGEALSIRIARSLKANSPQKVGEVVTAVRQAIPAKFYRKQNAVLSRVWQALRIEVNREFQNLELFLERSLSKLNPGGLLMVVSFHSLEDKIVTKFMRARAKPVSEDMYGNKTYTYEFLTKKPLLPSTEEVENNVRARSATLRILKKLGN